MKFHYEYAGQHHYQERQNNAVQRTQQRICTHKDMRTLLYELLLLLLLLLLQMPLLRWLCLRLFVVGTVVVVG